MKAQQLFFAFLIASSTSVFAQEEDERKTTLGGYVQVDHISFFKEKDGKVNGRNQGIAQLELNSKLANSHSFFSSVEFRNDLSDKSRDRVYLKEAYVDMNFKKWDLRFGKQIFSWGKADGFNPMNTLGAIDYTDVLDTDDEKLGIFAVNGKLYLGDFELQGVFSPVFSASVLPTMGGRWEVEMPSSIPINGTRFQPVYGIDVAKPAQKLKNSSFAVKLARSFSRLDLSLSYFNGFNHIPEILQGMGTLDADNKTVEINLLQQYYRHQVVSGDLSLSLGKYIFKGEGGLFFPEKIPNDKPYFQYVVGFDRTFSRVLGDNSLMLIVQWMHDINTDENVKYSGRDFNHLFQENAMARLELDISGTTKVSLQGIYALKYEDFYIKPKIAHNLSDGLNLVLSADLLGGEKAKDGLLSGYSDNSRVQVKMKYGF